MSSLFSLEDASRFVSIFAEPTLQFGYPMKTICFIFFALLCVFANAFSEPSEQEIITLTNKVIDEINSGHVNALNELMVLPGDWAVPSFIAIFKDNYNIYGETPLNHAIGVKCAELATRVPGGEDYMVKMLRVRQDENDNATYFQQITCIKLLICAHNNTSVRVCGSALDDPDVAGLAANALATMSLPNAPYSSEDNTATSDATGIAKWKQWWEGNKGNYNGPANVLSPNP
jgi:hypothetical protein